MLTFLKQHASKNLLSGKNTKAVFWRSNGLGKNSNSERIQNGRLACLITTEARTWVSFNEIRSCIYVITILRRHLNKRSGYQYECNMPSYCWLSQISMSRRLSILWLLLSDFVWQATIFWPFELILVRGLQESPQRLEGAFYFNRGILKPIYADY